MTYDEEELRYFLTINRTIKYQLLFMKFTETPFGYLKITIPPKLQAQNNWCWWNYSNVLAGNRLEWNIIRIINDGKDGKPAVMTVKNNSEPLLKGKWRLWKVDWDVLRKKYPNVKFTHFVEDDKDTNNVVP